jgi:TetR/AcrR family transcriptional regulator, lmrAB and yxaGH operons repressor
MVEAALELFRQRGYHATAMSDVIERSGAPRGSTYYYFPGGKRELAREAVALAGDEIEQMMAAAETTPPGDPASVVRRLAEMVAGRLEDSSFQGGCAIATMVLELAPSDEDLSIDFERVFARWRAALVNLLEPSGIAPERAVILADLVMSGFEGAMLLSRAARNSGPLRTTTDALARVIENETPFHDSEEAAPFSGSVGARRSPSLG